MTEHRLAALLHRMVADRPAWDDAEIDGALLEKFLADQDGEAFSALVARHGPLVLGVCRRILDNAEDAEDAFQAAFLVLARRAGSIRRRTSLASWLYGVADNLARKLRHNRGRRQLHERQAVRPEPASESPESDLRRVIEEELARLPDKYRTPLLLCYYEGRTNEETARQLSWRPGTVKSRLARGRELLRGRLHRRGLAVTLAALTAATEVGQAAVRVPPALAALTTRTALLVGAGNLLGGAAAPVALLVEGMMRTTMMQRTAAFALALVGLCLAGGGGWWAFHTQAAPPTAAAPAEPARPPADAKSRAADEEDWDRAPRVVGNGFPRRLLVVAPCNYAYADPIAYGPDDRSLPGIVRDFAELIHVPNDQVAVLSDRGARPLPPIKGMIQKNVARFLASCRPEDRAVVLFIGRAVEKDAKVYFLPIEGEAGCLETFIPLDWFYEQFKACRAQQKVFIVDVCRYNPGRGEELRTERPMSAEFEWALRKPPEGVQVVAACTAGQYSYEEYSRRDDDLGFSGGVMLNQISDLKNKGGLRGDVQKPEDPIPVEKLTRILAARTKSEAEFFLKKAQKVWTSGTVAEAAVPFDAEKTAAPRFVLRPSDEWKEFVATKAEIQRVLKVVAELPPLKGPPADVLDFEFLPPYPPEALADFADDGAQTPLRTLVLEAVQTMAKDHSGLVKLRFAAPPDDRQQIAAFKNDIVQLDKEAAQIQFKLASLREELLDAAIVAAREKEVKHWRAAYDFTLARLGGEIAAIYEYKVKLGELRKDSPARNPAIHDGWRLVANDGKLDALTEVDVRQAHKILDKMIAEYAGTPWEVIAKRERLRRFGLEWQPTSK